MKFFLAIFTLISCASSVWAFDKNYVCTYNVRYLTTINIYGRTATKFMTYSSKQTNGPIQIAIDDYNSQTGLVRIYGVLPAPWAANTSYEIEIRDMFTSTFRVKGSARTVSIPMTCREL